MNNNDSWDDQSDETVSDNEGSVDEKIKQRVIDARNRVDRREDDLFVKAAARPDVNITRDEALSAWSTSIQQYIRTVLPLLKSPHIKNSEYYYREVSLGELEIPPPDGEREWSRFAHTDNPQRLADSMALPPTFDPPEPKPVTFSGLKDILDRQRIQARWNVEIHRNKMLTAEVEHLSVDLPVPKSILEDAIGATDSFLQQAGIGMDIGGDAPEENPI